MMVLAITMEVILEEETLTQNNNITNPSTLPHFLLLLVISGFLYSMMQSDFGELGYKGSSIFLSITMSYCLAALFFATSYGNKYFMIEDKGMGILTGKYWILALKAIMPIILISSFLLIILNAIFSEESIDYFMSSLFILMSVGQGISIASGGVIYYGKKKIEKRSSYSNNNAIFRMIFIVFIFIPLIWWFGYGADNILSKSLKINFWWIFFAFTIGMISYCIDRYTSNTRMELNTNGAKGDKLMTLMILTISWHLLSSWRRNPYIVESTDALMIFEEAILMIITILLTVSAMVKKGKKRGWKIFEAQSALFWGVAFGYAYAGSISSLTSLSERLTESSLLQTTALGHLLTALVIILILPRSIKSMSYNEEY